MGLFAPTSRNRLKLRISPFDFVWAFVAPFAALYLRDPGLLVVGDAAGWPSPPYIFAAVATACALVAFVALRLSEGMNRFFSAHDVLAICGAVGATVAGTSIFMFTFTRLEGIPRSTPLIFALVLGGGLVLSRALHRAFASDAPAGARQRSDQLRNIVIVGVDRFTSAVVQLVASQSPPTTRVLALLDERPDLIGRSIHGVRVVGAAHDLDALVEEYLEHGVTVDQVLTPDPGAGLSEEAAAAIASVCAARGITCLPLSQALNLTPKPSATPPEPAAAMPQIAPRVSRYFRIKRAIDIVAALALLALLAPLALVVALALMIDVGSPLVFWQERMGAGGRRFLIYKFRTYAAPFDWRGDAIAPERRLSATGRFIRATRLDEIPQLMNVLVGDMSLIGPRPLLPQDQPDDPSIRLMVRPGVTGWAQVSGGVSVTAEEKNALDSWYIQHASPLLDLKILAHTIIIVLTGERLNRDAVRQAMSWRARAIESQPFEERLASR